jgi:hypothetical protein
MADGHAEGGFTRRDFLRHAGMAGIATLAGWRALEAGETALFAAENPSATAVLVRDQKVLGSDGAADPDVVRRMVAQGIQALTQEKDARAAWSSLFRTPDVVGVKFSRCGWMRVPTHQEVIDAVLLGLRTIPIPNRRLHWRDQELPVSQCTALVNVTSLKAHSLTGFAGAIKNYINFDPEPKQYHDEQGSKLGAIWVRPDVRGKSRLVVLDLLTPYFGNGPQIDPRYQADYRGVLLATDPVAADTVALSLLQRMRDGHKGKPWPISPPPLFLAAADKEYNLGTSDPERIKLVRLGWGEDALI